MNNHKISETCNKIHLFLAFGFCRSVGADVLQVGILLFGWSKSAAGWILDSYCSTCLSLKLSLKRDSNFLGMFFSKQVLETSKGRAETHLYSKHITDTLISTFLYSMQFIWPNSVSVDQGSLYP